MLKKNRYNRYFIKGTVLFFLLSSAVPLYAEHTTSLLINEVMYHPAENENTNEWIELYNPTSTSIDVNGWILTDGQQDDTLQGDVINGDGTTVIPSRSYAVITDKGTTVYDTFSVPDTALRLTVDDSTLCGYGLKNTGEKLILMDSEGNVIDCMEWGIDDEEIPGSPAPGVTKGSSLARFSDTDDSQTDFLECTTPTPGGDNSIQPPSDESLEDSDTYEENPPANPSLLITQFYYYTHTTWNNEFFTLSNPTTAPIDLTGWYFTDEPWKETSKQAKILFPDGLSIPAHTSWSITQNATAFFLETGTLPQYEYKVDSRPDIAQLTSYKTITFSNTGGVFALVDIDYTTIDLLVYGETDYEPRGWEGLPIPSSGAGVILTRTQSKNTWVDTNTAADWIHPRIYHIGQSDFPIQTIVCNGTITAFVSPDNSYETIVQELRNARCSIDINMYEFTDPSLCNELVAALQRNVAVRLFMEGSPIGGIDDREKYILTQIATEGGEVRFIVSDTKNHVNARYQFDHAKYMIIDNETVIVESCNWAKTGVPTNPTYGNREWGMIIRNKEVALKFMSVFNDDYAPTRIDSYAIEQMNFSLPSDFSLNNMIPTGSYHPRFNATTFEGSFVITPVFSPDSSEQALLDAIDTATTCIYVQQLYIYTNWSQTMSPLVDHLIIKADQGVTVKVILNYNPGFEDDARLNETTTVLEDHGISVKILSTDWAPFATVHNKGMIIDNKTVLISSINWNEQSVRKNREAGVLVENQEVASYYAAVFQADWALQPPTSLSDGFSWADYKYIVLIAVVFSIVGFLILRDWRKRTW